MLDHLGDVGDIEGVLSGAAEARRERIVRDGPDDVCGLDSEVLHHPVGSVGKLLALGQVDRVDAEEVPDDVVDAVFESVMEETGNQGGGVGDSPANKPQSAAQRVLNIGGPGKVTAVGARLVPVQQVGSSRSIADGKVRIRDGPPHHLKELIRQLGSVHILQGPQSGNSFHGRYVCGPNPKTPRDAILSPLLGTDGVACGTT